MKTKQMFKYYLTVILLLSGSIAIGGVPVLAGTFMLSEGQQMLTTGVTYLHAKDSFNQQHQSVPAGCTTQDYYWHNNYTYGYSYYHNIFVNANISHQTCTGQPTISGLGDVTVGVRGRLNKFRNGRTWEVALKLPTGYNATKVNRLGYGRVGLWVGGAWSTQNTGWEMKAPTYWVFGAGVQGWFGPPASQFRSYVKWSKRLDDRGNNGLVLGANLKLSFRDGRPQIMPALGFPRNPGDYDLLTLSAKYGHRLANHWMVSAAIGKHIWGRNAINGVYLDLSLTRLWD